MTTEPPPPPSDPASPTSTGELLAVGLVIAMLLTLLGRQAVIANAVELGLTCYALALVIGSLVLRRAEQLPQQAPLKFPRPDLRKLLKLRRCP